MRSQPVSVSKAKKAIADYRKAIGRPEGLPELSIFYCEVAFDFLESCGMENKAYFLALIRMYDQTLQYALKLSPAERSTYVERLNRLRSRARCLGWSVEDELNSLWYATEFDGQQSE
jgi:hypothetical protein